MTHSRASLKARLPSRKPNVRLVANGMVVQTGLDLETAQKLAETGRWLHAHGWAPATSGNFSQRTDAGIAITSSGRDKSQLTAEQILLVDLDGRPLGEGRPSAETLLHCQLYRRDPIIGAVLHTHSVAATVLSRRVGAGGTLVAAGYELVKAFPGRSSHEIPLRLPVVANSQDMQVLMAAAERALDAEPSAPAYLIAGHGSYVWGRDLAAARSQVEALEFLLACLLNE